MKLRIRDNSIRLRLTRGEVDSLRADGLVKARTEFPAGHEFGYELEFIKIDNNINRILLNYINEKTIYIYYSITIMFY